MFESDLLMPWRTVLDSVLLQADIRKNDVKRHANESWNYYSIWALKISHKTIPTNSQAE